MTVKNKLNFTLIIFLVLIILMVIFVIYPIFSRIKNNSEELIAKDKEFAELETKIENLEKFTALHEDVQYFLEEADNLFVESKIPVEFYQFLEKTENESGIKLTLNPPSENKAEGGLWPYLTFRIFVNGHFTNFLRFLEKIENGPYLVEVQSVSINKLSGEEDVFSSNIRVDFSFKVFVK